MTSFPLLARRFLALSLFSLLALPGRVRAETIEADLLVVGGSEYGHHTLTRFFALHAGVLPGLLVAFLVMHVAIFRKHGIHPKKVDPAKDCYFWPDQVLKDAIACVAVAGTVLALVWWRRGAELGAPANPAEAYSAARPDWYFMALFQLLKFQDWFQQHLPGGGLLWCVILIPGAIAAFLLLMPLLGLRKAGHFCNLAGLWVGLGFYGAFTAMAYWHDLGDPKFASQYAAAEETRFTSTSSASVTAR